MLFNPLPWYGRWALLLGLGVSLYGLGQCHGRRAEQARANGAERGALVQLIRTERKQAAISQAVATNHEAGRARDRIVYQTIEKEVTRYVASPDHTVCRLDRGWLRQHDAAALSRIAEPAGVADAATSDATSDDALRLVVTNYQACHDNERQLMDLQEWIRQQRPRAE